jgi:plasmid stabilization system protein ParE
MFRILITGPAKRDIQAAHDWWVKHRSKEQAGRWYAGIHAAIQSLEHMPERCGLATETNLSIAGVRQLLFGLGRKPSHRIVFGIEGDEIIIFRIRHTSQDFLSPDDLI